MPDDVLTQNEIDSLLAQAMGVTEAPGAAPERFRSVRPYDFRHPSKLSKEQLRTLQLIFESFARVVATNLSATLRSQVHMALVSIQQAVFDEYARGLSASTLLNLAIAPPLPGTFVYEYDLGTAFLMLERLLGGEGLPPQHDREVTEIEQMLLQTISGIFLNAFDEVWAHLVPVQAKLQRLEYSPRFLQIAPQNEPVVLLLFDLRVLERQTTLSLCLPYSVIEPVAQELNMQTLFTVAQKDAEAGEESSDAPARLQRVMVPMVAMLGSTVLPLGEVSSLQVDDVIRLDGHAADPIILTVNKKPTFIARPGLRRQGIAVQVLGVLPDEVE